MKKLNHLFNFYSSFSTSFIKRGVTFRSLLSPLHSSFFIFHLRRVVIFLLSLYSSQLKRVITFHSSLFTFHLKKTIIFSFSLFAFHLTSGQQLETYIEEALTNSPEIQKFELQYQITSEKTNEAHTIPNTEIGVGYFISEPETRTGAQKAKVSVRQMIPWFGSITARENYTNAIADAKYEDIVIAKRKLIVAVSQSYYNLYTITAQQKVVIKNIELLKTYETLALTSVEVGKASAVDVLRLQIRQNELSQVLTVLEQEYIAEQTIFNTLLNRDKTITVQVIHELTIPSENVSLTSTTLALHPELIKYDKLYQSVEQSELLNQKESNPMIGFGIDYIAVAERPNMNFSDNGKDIIMPMISLSIPLFNQKHKSKTRQNQLKQQEIKVQKQERLNTLESALDKAITDRKTARIRFDTQSKNLKQANDAEEILVKSYETGTIDFNDVLDIQELQLKFQMNQIVSVKAYFTATTIINYLSS